MVAIHATIHAARGARTVRDLTFALYKNVRDQRAELVTLPWDSWCEVFAAHEKRGDPADASDKEALDAAKDGPCIVLGEIPQGRPHANAEVIAVHAIGLDIEDRTEAQIEAALAALAPYEYALYTTHKHAAEAAHPDPELRSRLRVILPLAEPLAPADFARAWEELDAATNAIADRKTRNIGRLFFLPSTYDLGVAVAHRNRGEWLTPGALRGSAFTALVAGASTVEGAKRVRSALRTMPVAETTDDGTDLKTIARRALAGEPLAPAGERHNAALALTIWLAQRLREPPATDDVLAVFRPSLAAAKAEDPSSPGEADLAAAWSGAVEKARAWREENEKEKHAEALKAQVAQAGASSSYSDEELASIAKAQGCTVDALAKRWVLHAADQTFYLLDGDGGYKGPFGASNGRTAAVSILARAPVRLNSITQNGVRRRTLQEIAEDHGAASARIVVDLTKRISVYDAERKVLLEAARPLRTELTPHFEPKIDEWLRAFAGPNYDKLQDWLACVPDLTKLLCALYASGVPSSGKTLLAMGLAQLWAETPAKFDEVIGASFNDEILRCPFILADEDLGKQRFATRDLTGQIRSLISTLDRTVTRKYMPPCALRGAVRLVIAANNDFLLSSKESLSGQDLEAIAQRFLYIRAGQEASDFLATIPPEERERWKREGLARHALYLAATREVAPGRRFWVEGDITEMHRLVTITSDWTSRVCEWLVRMLMQPSLYSNRGDGLIRLGNGELMVNEQALVDGWRLYYPDTRIEPETAKIGAAIRAISIDRRPCLRWLGKRVRYRQINTETLFAWSDSYGIGERSTMYAALWGGKPPREPGMDDGDDDRITDDLTTVQTANEEPF